MDKESSQIKSKKSCSPISKLSERFQGQDYPLVVRILNRHLVITSPDFEFPVPIVLPYDPPSIETGGKAIIAAWLQIAEYLKELSSRGETHPVPKQSRKIYPKLIDEISIGEACRILGMKSDMVRTLADRGLIPCSRTFKGHRRFSRSKLEAFIREKTAHSFDQKNSS
jgi:excisionase family DNA binding protein